MVVSLAACGGGNQGEKSNSEGPPTQPTGSMTIRNSGGLVSTDPFTTNSVSDWQLLRQVYEGLLSLDDELKPIPMLAESWEVSEDGKTYVFKLRSDVKFHNMKTLDADDVVYSLTFYRDHAIRGKTLLGVLKDAKALDSQTVQLTLSEPSSALLTALGGDVGIAIVPKGSADDDGLATEPIGTGPYKVVNFRNETRADLEAFDGYVPIDLPSTINGGKKVAYVKKVTILNVPEDQTAVAGLTTGEYDIVDRVPPIEVDRLKQVNSISIQQTHGVQAHYSQFYVPKMQDVNLRRAIIAAVDKEALLNTTLSGAGRVTNTYQPPAASWYDEDAADYWPWSGQDAARDLLAKSSYNGESIDIVAGGFAYMGKNAVQIQQQLKAVGINAKVRQLDQTSFQAAIGPGNYQMYSAGGPAVIPALARYGEYYCQHGEIKSRYGYCSEDYDKLYEQAAAATDDAQTKATLAQMEKLLKDDAVFLPYYFSDVVVGVNNHIKGFQANTYGWLNAWNVWKVG